MGAADTDNFCLRWNDFAENVSGAFKDLRAEKDFFDVTLACSDSGAQTFQAHKVILSACSNFFKATFRQQMNANKHPNPYIYLRGVSYSDLTAILDFIYNGEVNVAQEDLNSFLAVAEELQIKGLTNRDAANSSDHQAPKKAPKVRPPPPLETPPVVKKAKKSAPAPKPVPAPVPQVMTSIADEKIIDIKDEDVVVAPDPGVMGFNNPNDFAGDDYDEENLEEYYGGEDGADMPEGMEGAEAGVEGGEGEPEPDITKGQEAFGLRFVRTKEGGLTYQCGLCGYLPNSSNKSIGYAKNRVTMHIRNVHSESTNVVCGGCSKRFKNKESLRVHRIKYCRDVDKVGSPIVAENAAQ